jgi:gluconate 2-dehydrogenase gamma chain
MLSRRDFATLSAMLWAEAVASAQHHHHELAPQVAAAGPTFFTPKERLALDRLTALIVPADERSGGALAAGVSQYIDTVVAHAQKPLQAAWRAGLKPYLDVADAEAMLTAASRNEFRPRTPSERFFVMLKDACVDGFYTSREGIVKELGYKGYTFLREFPGAKPEDLKAPAGYKPLLQQRS